MGMPATVNKINFSAVNLPSSSAVPVDDGKIAAQREVRTCAFASWVKVPTCDRELSWGCLLRLRTLQRFSLPTHPCPSSSLSSLQKNFGVGNLDYFGSERCKSTTSGSSGEVGLVC